MNNITGSTAPLHITNQSNISQVIAAEGEQKASRALREAAEVISESPSALQVRMTGLLVSD